jgi:hypothetical protein
MKRTPVTSSNLRNVGFDPKRKVMEIGFKSGRVYEYTGVSAQRHRALMQAASHGKYHWKFVRTSYPYTRTK